MSEHDSGSIYTNLPTLDGLKSSKAFPSEQTLADAAGMSTGAVDTPPEKQETQPPPPTAIDAGVIVQQSPTCPRETKRFRESDLFTCCNCGEVLTHPKPSLVEVFEG